MQENLVQSLGLEPPLEEEIATHSSILAWKIPWTKEPGGLQSTGLQRVAHDWVHTHTSLFECFLMFLILYFVITQCFLLSVQFSRSVMSNSLWHEPQHAKPPCPSPTPGVHPNPCPWSQWCHATISSSVIPFSSCPQSFPASGSFPWISSSHQVAKVLEFQLQHQSFQWTPRTDLLLDGLVGSPCSPRDSQESSPTPQFKSINSSALSFLYGPTLTSIHDYWKNHSPD